MELHGVAVERAQAFDGAVVVEGRLAVEGELAQLGQADELEVGQPSPGRALHRRVGEAFEGIDVVLGDELTLLAFEGFIVSKEDAGLDAHRPDLEVRRDLGHAHRRERAELGWPRKRVVLVERLEDVWRHGTRVDVADLRRVEPRLGHREGIAQHLLRRAGLACGGGAGHRAGQTQCGAQGQGVSTFHGLLLRCSSALSMSTYFQEFVTKTLRW